MGLGGRWGRAPPTGAGEVARRAGLLLRRLFRPATGEPEGEERSSSSRSRSRSCRYAWLRTSSAPGLFRGEMGRGGGRLRVAAGLLSAERDGASNLAGGGALRSACCALGEMGDVLRGRGAGTGAMALVSDSGRGPGGGGGVTVWT